MTSSENPKFFKTASAFRSWLEKNHSKKKEIWVGYYKKDSGKKAMTYHESIDEALCFGWIDGIRKKHTEDTYVNRFTPRKPNSSWSRVNIDKVKQLINLGKMEKPGMDAYKANKKNVTKYSFEQKTVKLPPAYEKKFRADKKAWEFFKSQPPSYRKTAMWWVMSAKQEGTHLRRLNTLIGDSKNCLRIKELRRNK